MRSDRLARSGKRLAAGSEMPQTFVVGGRGFFSQALGALRGRPLGNWPRFWGADRKGPARPCVLAPLLGFCAVFLALKLQRVRPCLAGRAPGFTS